MKFIKWLLVLLILLGALYFVTGVKVGQSTIFQRIMGDDSKKNSASVDKVQTRKSRPAPAKDEATDIHTSSEKKGLENLIEKRLEHDAANAQ